MIRVIGLLGYNDKVKMIRANKKNPGPARAHIKENRHPKLRLHADTLIFALSVG
jgi:hypothetical protein